VSNFIWVKMYGRSSATQSIQSSFILFVKIQGLNSFQLVEASMWFRAL